MHKIESKMFPTTLIWRHAKERLSKCSLRGLESRSDMSFLRYPKQSLPCLHGYLLLSVDAPLLSMADGDAGLLLLDGTWRYAEKMTRALPVELPRRSLPAGWTTAYPRRQPDCPDPNAGLASIEALFAAYTLLNRPTDGLLDHYLWKKTFLEQNRHLLASSDCIHV